MRTRRARRQLLLARSGPLTLLTATKDIDHSQAAVLIEHLHSAQ
jgi:uncharacterized protein YeaO (DUF488 family)